MPVLSSNTIELTLEQEAAVEYVLRKAADDGQSRFGGLGGTGKSTCLAEMCKRLPGWAVCAYTGKAANVLRRKGITSASTIHSLIYVPETDEDGQVVEPVEFRLREPHELAVEGFLVDEASMISAEIYRDLKTFDRPMVFVGDHGQLEPVGSGESGFCLMRDPDVALETIHRNAGEIARFAEWLRNGNDACDWSGNAGQVSVITGDQLASCGVGAADQMICAYNRTRCMMNDAVRDQLGLPRGEPVVGDRVICLQNDRELGLFNGMQGVLIGIEPAKKRLSFCDEDGREYRGVPYIAEAFGSEKTPKRVPDRVPFDWAYCCTAHKMQGSEADDVVVLEQRCGLWEHCRWAYTAASRAKRRLTWVLEG